jgi:hypothetical protein
MGAQGVPILTLQPNVLGDSLKMSSPEQRAMHFGWLSSLIICMFNPTLLVLAVKSMIESSAQPCATPSTPSRHHDVVK